jgi:hypothetical protein
VRSLGSGVVADKSASPYVRGDSVRAPDGPHRSDRVTLRHGPLAVYRCFLPDLAGFTGLPCARPDHHRGMRHPAPTALTGCTRLRFGHPGPLHAPAEAGGEAGIRTRGGVSPTHALQACSFSHSDTSPHTRSPSVPVRFGFLCEQLVLAEDSPLADGQAWRRGWDSNPRGSCPPTRFRGGPVTTASVPLRSNPV